MFVPDVQQLCLTVKGSTPGSTSNLDETPRSAPNEKRRMRRRSTRIGSLAALRWPFGRRLLCVPGIRRVHADPRSFVRLAADLTIRPLYMAGARKAQPNRVGSYGARTRKLTSAGDPGCVASGYRESARRPVIVLLFIAFRLIKNDRHSAVSTANK